LNPRGFVLALLLDTKKVIRYNKELTNKREKMPKQAVNGPDMGCPEPGRKCEGCQFPCEGDS
jgi:hypothetical protein